MLSLFGALTFVFAIYQDPFTDRQTFLAEIGDVDRGPGISIACSPQRENWTVRILPGQLVDRPVLGYENILVRFDDQPASTVFADYESREVLLEYEHAETFAQNATSSQRVIIGIRGPGNERQLVMQLPLTGAADAIAQVQQRCQAAK